MKYRQFFSVLAILCVIEFLGAGGLAFANGAKEQGAAKSAATVQKAVTLQWDANPSGDPKKFKLEPLVKKFEAQNPGIKVNLQTIPFASYDQSVETAIRGGGGPDVMDVNFVDLGTWQAAGFLQDISSYMSASGRSASDYNPGFYADGSIKGGQYGLPLDMDSRCLYYNKTIFAKYGLTPPKTWNDMLSIAKVLKQHGIYGFALQMDNPWSAVWEASGPLLVANGGKVLNKDGTKAIAAGDAATLATYRFVFDTLRPYYPPGISSMNGNTVSSLFANGKLGVYIGGPWVADQIESDNPKMVYGKTFAVVENPVAPATGKSASAGGGWFIGLNANGSHLQQAWKLMEYVTSKDNAKFMAQFFGGFPVWRGAAKESPWGTKPLYSAFVKQLPSTASPVLPLSPQLSTIVQNLYKQMQQMVTGSETVKKGLENFDNQTNAILGQ